MSDELIPMCGFVASVAMGVSSACKAVASTMAWDLALCLAEGKANHVQSYEFFLVREADILWYSMKWSHFYLRCCFPVVENG